MEARVKRRHIEDDHETQENVYRFKILIPDGLTVGLRLIGPGNEMGIEEFLCKVNKEYVLLRRHQEPKRIRPVNWSGGNMYLEDANDNKYRNRINFACFKPHKCHFLKFHDGSPVVTDTYENMWDLTPDTDLLRELPDEYTFETALADLIDNSLQAVWFKGTNNRRLIRVDIEKDKISIFDTGPGMDNSDENSIVKWGKMGASIHRSSKAKAIGGKPPYLMPYFGMFGYGGPIASMHLGRRALVSSKTKESRKVYTLHLEREALLNSPHAEQLAWRTNGGMRNPSKEETEESPDGSFTKVEISELKMKNMDVFRLQCRLKDIYFPYIQCDDLSNKGKTATPITIQVNGVDLAEIEGGEVSITNLHSCNGPDFVFQLHFTVKQDLGRSRSPGTRASQEANARLKCIYFPIVEGKESIEKILEKLEFEGCVMSERFETFSRVSIRRLGRLLPDARWAPLPFMEFSQKKGDDAHLLKRCCSRVKCFIEADAGFIPTPSKTDLAHHNLFSTALKNFGNKKLDTEKEVDIEISQAGGVLSPSVFEKKYRNWILQMHDQYDEEVDSGEDDPVLVVCPTNKKGLGISSDVVRVHRALKRKGVHWKSGQKIKVLKGACPRVHKSNLYATIEYFLIEGFQGDAGGEARIICRPLDVADNGGCTLEVKNGNVRLDISGSLSLPISVVDSRKCLAIDTSVWSNQLEKQRLNAPSRIDLLGAKHGQELEVGALPFDATIIAGKVPPSEVVAIVRPASFMSSSMPNSLDQKYIVKSNFKMSMEVKFRRDAKDSNVQHIYSNCIDSSCHKGINGLYIFPLGQKFPRLFQEAGVYKFVFSLVGSSCKDLMENVRVRPSSAVWKWKLLNDNSSKPCIVSVGSTFPKLDIAYFDSYDNQIPFESLPVVTVELKFHNGMIYEIDKVKTSLSSDKLTLEVKEMLIECPNLDETRPTYEATLLIRSQDNLVPLSIPCKVLPGSLKHVVAHPLLPEKELLPGFVFKELVLELFDDYGNHAANGSGVQLKVDGVCILDQIGSNRKVDDSGCIDLSGLLKVTAGFGNVVSISVLSDNEVVFKQEFPISKRELRLASKVPESLTAGSQLENVVFQVVDSEGKVDETIHDEDKYDQFHTLKIKSDTFNLEDFVHYAFRHGCSTVPVIPLPSVEGQCSFVASHSRYPELKLSFNVSLIRALYLDYNEIQSPCSDGKIFLLKDSASLNHVGNFPKLDNAGNIGLSIVNLGKGLEDDVCKYGQRIGNYESQLKMLDDMKVDCEQSISELQASVEPQLFNNLNHVNTKEQIVDQIKSRSHPAAAIVGFLSSDLPLQAHQKHFTRDVVGVVALLGAIHSDKLSRILAEYLGEDQMLAVVCSSYEAVSTIEKYTENGEVDRYLGNHFSGRFLVICLEDLRVFSEVQENNPQRILALPDPIMPKGNIASGFLGYAVNMINLDLNHLDIKTRAGHGLRETLFYCLFGELQVYQTREHMNKARACIRHGAVSLDGGILRENGIISLGHGNPEICFPIILEDEVEVSPAMMEVKKQVEVKERELQEINGMIAKLTKSHEKAMKKFNKKSERYRKFIDQF